MRKEEILYCPRCKKPVEAKDYMNPAFLAILESILPSINCKCGYTGLPIKLPLDKYKKLTK